MAFYPITHSYTTEQVRSIAQRGQLLLIRNGAIQQDYGDGAATASEYGIALTNAIAALQAGDSLHMRGFEASGKEWDINTNNVRVIAEEVTLLPQATYDFALRFNGTDDCYLQGMHVDGKQQANSGYGIAYWLFGDRNRMRGNSSRGTRGLSSQSSSVWWHAGTDGRLENHVSIDDGWYGVAVCQNRFVLDGFYCVNPLSRALNPFAVAALDYQVFRNIQAVQTVLTDAASIMFNANHDYNVGDLYLENSYFHHGDNVSPGYSWDEGAAAVPQLAKFENITRLHINHCWWDHARNTDPGGASQTMRFDSPPQVRVAEMYITDSYHAGAFTFGLQRPDIVHWKNCVWGGRYNDRLSLVGYLSCLDFLAEHCTFYSWDNDVIHWDTTHLATDWTRILNCRFISNSASDRYVRYLGTPRTNIGRIVFAGNTMDNLGAGNMYLSSSELDTLALTTDRNGDMLFDSTLVGTGAGKHPAPGAGPNHFSGLPVPNFNGAKIRNINWDTDSGDTYPERIWVSKNSLWKDGT